MAAETKRHIIPADEVQGTPVFNRKGDRLGTVRKVMIDKSSGAVVFTLMSFGGFLGIGEKFHPLPWGVLKYDRDKGGYLVDLDKEVLLDAPVIERDADFQWADDAWANRIYEYYKVQR